MNDIEKYQFDLNGYLLVKRLLSREETERYLAAANELEAEVARHVNDEPLYTGHFGIRYHFDTTLGYSSYKNDWGGGIQYIVDDFLNASLSFDGMVGHRRTMAYVEEFSSGPFQIASSELRYRHKGNLTLSHMGGSIDARNRYEFFGRPILDAGNSQRSHRDFDLLCVRVIYALHDVPMENGAFCAVPGSHKANYYSPYGDDPTKEPGMVGIAMEAGDGLFFTENLRHGGLPNLLDQPRKTIHLTFSPVWAGSQSPAHWNGGVYVAPAAWKRYDTYQRSFFPSPTASLPPVPVALSGASDDELRREIDRLNQEVHELQARVDKMERSLGWRATTRLRMAADLASRARRRLGW